MFGPDGDAGAAGGAARSAGTNGHSRDELSVSQPHPPIIVFSAASTMRVAPVATSAMWRSMRVSRVFGEGQPRPVRREADQPDVRVGRDLNRPLGAGRDRSQREARHADDALRAAVRRVDADAGETEPRPGEFGDRRHRSARPERDHVAQRAHRDARQRRRVHDVDDRLGRLLIRRRIPLRQDECRRDEDQNSREERADPHDTSAWRIGGHSTASAQRGSSRAYRASASDSPHRRGWSWRRRGPARTMASPARVAPFTVLLGAVARTSGSCQQLLACRA